MTMILLSDIIHDTNYLMSELLEFWPVFFRCIYLFMTMYAYFTISFLTPFTCFADHAITEFESQVIENIGSFKDNVFLLQEIVTQQIFRNCSLLNIDFILWVLVSNLQSGLF